MVLFNPAGWDDVAEGEGVDVAIGGWRWGVASAAVPMILPSLPPAAKWLPSVKSLITTFFFFFIGRAAVSCIRYAIFCASPSGNLCASLLFIEGCTVVADWLNGDCGRWLANGEVGGVFRGLIGREKLIDSLLCVRSSPKVDITGL